MPELIQYAKYFVEIPFQVAVFTIHLGKMISCSNILGASLKEMFKQHGSFETLEVQVRKRSTKSFEKGKSGGWYTKQHLESKEGWTKYLSYLVVLR